MGVPEPKVSKIKPYTVLTASALAECMRDAVKETVDVLSLPFPDAAVLLRHYRWKKSQLEEDWFKDSKKVLVCSLFVVY